MNAQVLEIHPRVRILSAAATPDPAGDFARDVRTGLTASPRRLSCKYLYDEHGSELFERICDLDEYYLTRAEREILEVHGAEIASRIRPGSDVVELGSGSGAKTAVLISTLLGRDGEVSYVPIDVSPSAVEESARALVRRFPGLSVDARVGVYEFGLRRLPPADSRVVLWLGSSIGNLDRAAAAAFLRDVIRRLSTADRLLVGIDLRKDAGILEAAYDDREGVTAEFNLNLLRRINRELGGTFDLGAFEHRARWVEDEGRVEMHLVSRVAQTVRVEGLGLDLDFGAGDAIHTESSYKYSLAEIDRLADDAGLRTVDRWLDDRGRFSLTLFRIAPAGDR